MNDPNDMKDIVDIASVHGWIVALLLGTWGIVLRWLIGQHTKREDARQAAQAKWVQDVNDNLSTINMRLAVIEARSHRLRRGDQ